MISLADILATTAAIVGEPLARRSSAPRTAAASCPRFSATSGEAARGHDRAQRRRRLRDPQGPMEMDRGRAGRRDQGRAPASSAPTSVRAQLYNTCRGPRREPRRQRRAPGGREGELRALLNRYRDGGYSRELPPRRCLCQGDLSAHQRAQDCLCLTGAWRRDRL
jgi:arylsulfatase A